MSEAERQQRLAQLLRERYRLPVPADEAPPRRGDGVTPTR